MGRMTLDNLLELLRQLRDKHGGGFTVKFKNEWDDVVDMYSEDINTDDENEVITFG